MQLLKWFSLTILLCCALVGKTQSDLMDSIRVFEALGDQYVLTIQYDSAAIFFAEALDGYEQYLIDQSQEDVHWDGYVQAFKRYTHTQYRARNDQAVANSIERVESFLNKGVGTSHPLYAAVLDWKGQLQWDLNDLEAAMEYFTAALALLPDGKYHNLRSDIYRSIGLTHYFNNKISLSRNALEEALKWAKEGYGPQHDKVSIVWSNLSVMYQYLGEFQKSLEASKAGLAICEKIYPPYHPERLYFHGEMGIIYRQIGALDKAEDHNSRYLEGRQRAYGENGFETINPNNNMGNLYQDRGEYEKAMRHIRKALSIVEAHPQQTTLQPGTYVVNIGVLYDAMGQQDSAYVYSKRGLELLSKEKNASLVDVGYANFSFGEVLRKQGDLEEAERYYLQAKAEYLKAAGASYFKLYEVYNGLGLLARHVGAYDEALNWTQKSLAVLLPNQPIQDPYQPLVIDQPTVKVRIPLLQTLLIKANTLVAQANKAQDASIEEFALQTFEQASNLIDLIRKDFRRDQSRQFLIEQAYPVYEGYLALLSKRNRKEDMEKAFTLLEKSKSLHLLSVIQQSQVTQFQGVPDEVLDSLQILNQNLAESEQGLFYYQEAPEEEVDPAQVSALKDRIYLIQQKKDAFLTNVKQAYPQYYQLIYGGQFATTEDLRQVVLEEDQALISFFEGDDQLFALKMSNESSRLLLIPDLKEIRTLIQRVRTRMYEWAKLSEKGEQKIEKTALAQDLQQLYQKVWKPIVQDGFTLPEQLFIVPDGGLGYLPLEMLLNEEGQYILHDHEMSYAYSASLLHQAYLQKPSSDLEALVVAPAFVSTDAEHPSLRYNLKEAHKVRESLDGVILEGSNASRADFLKEAPNYQLLHIATHGVAGEAKDAASFLVFTGENGTSDLLYNRDLYQLKLPAELVVLSACETALGPLKRGEGLISLAYGFTYAGAKSLTTSLWSINDRATLEMMDTYYQALQSGATKSAALRTAKQTFLANHPESDHPHYWAGLVGLGNMRPLFDGGAEQGGWPSEWPLYLLIGLLIWGGLLWVFRRKTR